MTTHRTPAAERYERVMLSANAGFWDWDVLNDEFYASPRLLEMEGFPPGTEFSGREDFLRRAPFHREDREKWQQAVKQLFASGGARVAMEVRAIVRGETRWRALDGMCFRDANGKVVQWSGSSTDITERKRAEALLAGEKDLLEMMARATALPTVLNALCHIVEENVTGCLCSILLVDASGTRLEHGAAPSLPREYFRAIHGAAVDPDAGPCGMAASLKEQVIANDIAAETRWIQHGWCGLALSHGLRSCWSAPIMSSAKSVLGTFAVYFRHPSNPTDGQRGVIERFTHLAAVAIERSRGEEELRRRQEMLDLAQKSARAIAFEWRIGAGEGENRWSPDLEAMYGVAPGTYDGSFEAWKKLVHPEDWAAVKEAIKQAMSTGDVASEYRVVHADGSVHWLQAKGRMFFDGAGNAIRLVGFMQDVTQRKHAEEELQKMEQELRRAQRLEAMGTLAGGIAHDFNNILGAILGYGEMALRGAKKGTQLRRDVDAMILAGDRGRTLVDRILAFSRSGLGERAPVHSRKWCRKRSIRSSPICQKTLVSFGVFTPGVRRCSAIRRRFTRS